MLNNSSDTVTNPLTTTGTATYANEMWHYELASEPGGICPRPVADASAE